MRGAATFVRWAMLMIRTVRYPKEVAHVRLEAVCRALEGAGPAILAAGSRPPREREAAFRALVTEWLRRGGTEMMPHGGALLTGVPDARESARETREELLAHASPTDRVPGGKAVGLPERAELRMVFFTEESRRGSTTRRAASALVHLAVPGEEGAPWRMRVLDAADPVGLRARTGAFEGAVRVRVDPGDREIFVAGEAALIVDTRCWDGLA
ncbi:hypothetical protein ACFXKD_02645 [Nocardiopsis aegyptia]|uniref:hypothetical protein n=1 Tax=Nocardiopsis aegyptia TaxID=220378 RepID=UPI00367347E7